MRYKQNVLFAISLSSVFVSQAAWANTSPESSDRATSAQPLSMQVQPAITVKDWMAQIEASQVQIIGVRLEETEMGLQVILETADGALATPTTTVVDNVLTAEIPNAALALPEGEAFEAANPVVGIGQVSITELPEGRVRVAISGTDAPPTAEANSSPSGLIFAVTPGVTDTAQEETEVEITVTADRADGYNPPNTSVGTLTNTPLIDIPASIQVIPEEVIEDQGASDLLDVLRNTPGIITNSSPRDLFSEFTIRGFNTGNSFLRNGIRDNDFGRTGFDLNNVERVEVLRGPASVLYGQIAPGGAINVVTKKPLSSPLYDIEAKYGSFDTYQGAIDFSGPLSEDGSVSYRLNASIFGSDTFVDEIDIDRYLIAPVIAWKISDNTNITFEAEYLDAQYPNERGLPIEGTILPNPNGTLPRNRYLGDPSFDRNNRLTIKVGYDLEHRFNDNWRLRNTFRFIREENAQDSVAPFDLEADLRTQQRGAFVSNFVNDSGLGFSQNNYEATLSAIGNFKALGADHELVIGADFFHQTSLNPILFFREIGPIDIFNPVYNQPLGAVIETFDPSSRKATDFGIYIQDQITFSDQFILLLGGRFDYVNQSNTNVTTSITNNQSDTAFSPRIGLVYKPRENVSLYGSFSQSFQQVTGRSLDNTLFNPSRGTQYEIGVKADWLESRLSTTLSLYHLTLSNVETSDPRNPDFSIQTGEQRSQGLELNLAGEILPGWKVIAGYAYTDAEVSQDNDIPIGNRLANVPEHSANLWTTYTIQTGDLAGLGFGLGLFYVADRPGDLDNTFTLPDYFRTDASIYYRRDKFRVQLNFKNLFDTRYFESAGGRNRIFPGAPFEVLATVGVEF